MFRILYWLFLCVLIVADPYFSSLLYQNVPNQLCSRFYHRNGGIGCRTSLSGISGVLVSITSNDELETLKESKWDSIVVLINSTLLSDQLIQSAMKISKVVGIAIYGEDIPTGPYSPLLKTVDGKGSPTESIALHPEVEWNPNGSGVFYQDLEKPIVQISKEESIPILLEKAQRNKDNSAINEYIMEINTYMGPDEMNSPTCLSKGACMPMGGQSIWSLAGKRDTRPILLVATALDSVSNIYDAGEDGMNAGVRISVLLSIVHALEAIQLQNASKQLMVAFFEGESWGRVGSRFFLADLADFKCENEVPHESSPFNDRMCASPLRLSMAFTDVQLSSIEKVILLDQLLPMEKHLYFHTESEVPSSLFEDVVSIHPATNALIPPGPGESFYQAGIANTVVITGYDTVFSNNYLGSVYHDPIDVNKTEAIANTLLHFVLHELNVNATINVESEMLLSLLDCLSINGNCTVMETIMSYETDSITSQLNHKPMNKFAGTYHRGKYPLLTIGSTYAVNYTLPIDPTKTGIYFAPSLLESFVQTALTLAFNSNRTSIPCSTWKECRSIENGFCIQGKCVASNAYFHNAVDPAIDVVGIDSFGVNQKDNRSPIYTEPYWGGYYGLMPYATVYQKTSLVTEWVTFLIGIVVVVAAWYMTRYFFSNYAAQLKLGKYGVC